LQGRMLLRTMRVIRIESHGKRIQDVRIDVQEQQLGFQPLPKTLQLSAQCLWMLL